MQFELVFKHTYLKQFGNILCVYESSELYLVIIKDRSAFYHYLINKDLNMRAEITNQKVNCNFPDQITIDISDLTFYRSSVDPYLKQCINSRGMNLGYYQKHKIPVITSILFLTLFLGTLIAGLMIKKMVIPLLILSGLLLMISIKFVIKNIKIKSANKENAYFESLGNKRFLDDLYILYKEYKLVSLVDCSYLNMRLNKQLRPELNICCSREKSNLVLNMKDDYIKYIIINNKTGKQKGTYRAMITISNNINSIEQLNELINETDI